MSQSSETTIQNELLMLGYPEQVFFNDYYTARVTPEYGACVAKMIGAYFIQFFPWGEGQAPNGHHRYAAFIMRQAGRLEELDKKYDALPYFKLGLSVDLLTIKCLIEEGIKECHASSKLP